MGSSSLRWVSGILLLVAATTAIKPVAGAQAPPGEKAISRADAIADLDALFAALERIHPDPYFNRSRELVMADRRRVADALPESMTHNQLWTQVARLVASLGDTAADWGHFKNELAGMFRRIADEEVGVLIVDLRRNGGGYSEYGDELLRYLTRTPYRGWTRRELKRSKEMRAESSIPPPIRWAPFKYVFTDPRRIFTGPPGTLAVWTQTSLKTPRRAEPFFTGPVCVLTGPATFSAAVVLADSIKTFHLATIVGEETGGRANTTMVALPYQLPHSLIPVSIASGRNVQPMETRATATA